MVTVFINEKLFRIVSQWSSENFPTLSERFLGIAPDRKRFMKIAFPQNAGCNNQFYSPLFCAQSVVEVTQCMFKSGVVHACKIEYMSGDEYDIAVEKITFLRRIVRKQ